MENIILQFRDINIPVIIDEFNYNTRIVNMKNFIIDYVFENFFKGASIPSKVTEIELNGHDNEFTVIGYIPDDRNNYRNRTYHSTILGTFDMEKINQEELLENRYLIFSKRINNSVVLNKYKITKEKQLEFNSKIIIYPNCENKTNGFKYILNGEEINIPEIKSFFNQAIICNDYEEDLKSLIYDNHLKDIASKDIYIQYLLFLKKINCSQRMPIEKIFKFYSYIAPYKFLYLYEFYIKNNIDTETLLINNPIYTNKPYEDISSIKKVSSTGMDIVNGFYREDRTKGITLIAEMENNPKIGVNGIKLITEINEYLNNINIHDCWSIFSSSRTFDFYNSINIIINTFDISLKTLLDRAVKNIFTQQIGIERYISEIIDYIEMKKQLGLEIEKKLPKNILELHDSLSKQLKDIERAQVKEQFKIQAKENKKLSDKFNSDYSHSEFIVIAPTESNDLIIEGQNMHHCVGSYIERLANGYSKIFFIRQKSSPEISFATIELDKNNNLIQSKAKFNSEVTKETKQYINQFVKYLGGEIYE